MIGLGIGSNSPKCPGNRNGMRKHLINGCWWIKVESLGKVRK
jgi:hypothetical protein